MFIEGTETRKMVMLLKILYLELAIDFMNEIRMVDGLGAILDIHPEAFQHFHSTVRCLSL